jgi:hypothetical protein
MGPVGDAEAVRTDVPPPARWVFPVGLGLSKGLGKRAHYRDAREPVVNPR